MKKLLSLLALGALIAALASSCSSSGSANALRSNDGIPIYGFPGASSGSAPC